MTSPESVATTTRDRLLPRAALPSLLPVLLALVVALQISLIFRAPLRILDRPLTEDGYYALAIARNIAHGLGASVDGVHPTNGFQPLFTLLTVPIFWIAGRDPIAPMRWLLALHMLVYVATAAVLGSIARQAWSAFQASLSPSERESWGDFDPGWVAAFLYLAGVGTFLQHTNGLETGFYVFLIVVAWRVYQGIGTERAGGTLALGITLGLVVLARIDATILVVIVTAGELWRRRRNPGEAILSAGGIALIAALISSPWWLYNLMGFGSLMPTSGSAQQEFLISYERFERSISAWLADAVPWIYARRGGYWTADLFRVAVLVPVVLAIRAAKAAITRDAARDDIAPLDPVKRNTLARTDRFGAWIVLYVTVLAVWYGVSSWASHFYVRYLSPMFPVATLAATLAAQRYIGRRRALALLAGIGLLASMMFVTLMLHQGRVFGRNLFHEDQLALIERHVPDDEWVSAAQTGTLGYFRPRVLNLDGKVNPVAYASRKDIAGYLDREGIRWFCDWPVFVEQYFGKDPRARGWTLVDQQGEFRLYRRSS